MTNNNETPKLIQPFSSLDISEIKLGEDSVLIGFESRDELNQLIAAMLDQGKKEMRYLSNKFDRQVFGSAGVCDAIKQFLINSRMATVKTLVSSSQEFVQSGGRLIELLRSNMPRVECRTRRIGNSDQSTFSGSFILIDDHGYIYLPDPERFKGTACFNAVGTVDKFSEVFVGNWNVASTDAEMQPIYI